VEVAVSVSEDVSVTLSALQWQQKKSANFNITQ
jgi:hypothetical protein